MGKTQSKNSDNNGEIVNNLVIDDTVQIENSKILTLLLVIAILKLVHLIYFWYKDHKRGLKKKYANAVIQV